MPDRLAEAPQKVAIKNFIEMQISEREKFHILPTMLLGHPRQVRPESFNRPALTAL